MDDFYVPWDGGERYVKKLEARIAGLEAVAEAAVALQSLYDDSVPVVGGKWDVLEDALRASGYLGVGDE